MHVTRRRRIVVALAGALVLLGIAEAWAYYAATGTGDGTGMVGTLGSPAPVTATAPSSTVTVGWSAVPSPNGVNANVTYAVERRPEPGSTWTTAGGTCGSALAQATTSCQETPATGTYVYRVTANFKRWTSQASSSPVAVAPSDPAPTVTDVTSSTANGTYKTGATISIQVTFSESVTVLGTPALTLETGANDRNAAYSSGSGSSTLTFNYTVQAGDTSADLDYVATNSLSAGTSIKDGGGNDADRTLATPGSAHSLGANKDLLIDTNAPTVTDVTSSTANGSYRSGATVNVQVVFSEPVTVVVAPAPALTLETGATDRTATYAGGSGTTTLNFTYVVQATDASTDLDYVANNSLTAGTSIRDAAGNDANRTLAAPGQAHSLAANKAIVIDNAAPTVANVTAVAADWTYKAGAVLPIQVVFSENVFVTGTPTLLLETGSIDRNATFSSGSGTNTLTFDYAIQSGDTSPDLDYQSTGALAVPGGATIRDAAGNDATRTLPQTGSADSLGGNKNIVIDTTAPTVSSVSSSVPNGTYGTCMTIPVTVTFSEAVVVTGTPQLSIATGSPSATLLDYASGSGTNALTFNYVVAAGNSSSDLATSGSTALTENGGRVRDVAGNDALLIVATSGGNSLAGSGTIGINTTSPSACDVQADASGGASANTLDSGDKIVLTFSTTMNAASIKSGWNGSSLAVAGLVQVDTGGANGASILTFPGGSSGVNLGSIDLGDTTAPPYAVKKGAFDLDGTMSMATVSGRSVLTITITSNSASSLTTGTAAPTLRWTPSTSAKDTSNRAMLSYAFAETGAADADF